MVFNERMIRGTPLAFFAPPRLTQGCGLDQGLAGRMILSAASKGAAEARRRGRGRARLDTSEMGRQHKDGKAKASEHEKEQRDRRRGRRPVTAGRVAEDAAGEAALALPIGLGLFIAALAVYVQTAYPTVPGGDAGELVFTSCSLGVAHPPGYPLFILLGHIFFRLVPGGSPGFRVNCLSCVCGAGAALLLFLFCQRWYSARGHRASCGLALLAAGLWAFSPLVWQYHVQAEVFSLNNLLVAAQFYLAHLHHQA
ncbi:MAG: DUF2723 domain-containing protein, partial [Promethearchaeia archaeon]